MKALQKVFREDRSHAVLIAEDARQTYFMFILWLSAKASVKLGRVPLKPPQVPVRKAQNHLSCNTPGIFNTQKVLVLKWKIESVPTIFDGYNLCTATCWHIYIPDLPMCMTFLKNIPHSKQALRYQCFSLSMLLCSKWHFCVFSGV